MRTHLLPLVGVLACGGGVERDQLDVQVSGMALVLGAAGAGVPLEPTDPGPAANGETQLYLALRFEIDGDWLQSGGPFCKSTDLIGVSESVALNLVGGGTFAGTGVVPLRSGGGGGHAPGCNARTGIRIRRFESVVLAARVPLPPWNELELRHQCNRQEAPACNGVPDINCIDDRIAACQEAAWRRTLWYRAEGQARNVARIGTQLEGEAVVPSAELDRLNDNFEATGRVELSADLVLQIQ